MRLSICLALALSALATGCCKSKSDSSSTSNKGDKPGDITITKAADGGIRVTGGGKMTGAPKDCAAFNACCTAPDAALFCGLVKSSSKDCASAATQVRNFLKEKGTKLPAGCM